MPLILCAAAVVGMLGYNLLSVWSHAVAINPTENAVKLKMNIATFFFLRFEQLIHYYDDNFQPEIGQNYKIYK